MRAFPEDSLRLPMRDWPRKPIWAVNGSFSNHEGATDYSMALQMGRTMGVQGVVGQSLDQLMDAIHQEELR